MNQTQYLEEFKKITDEMIELTKRKNTDYAGAKNAFHNFQQIEQLTKGRISVESGILVRMTDKLSRIANLLHSGRSVTDETIMDTLTDLAVYSIILRIYLNDKPYPVEMLPRNDGSYADAMKPINAGSFEQL